MDHMDMGSVIGDSSNLWARDDCVTCNSTSPVCNCGKGEQCVLSGRTCNQCPTIQCIKGPSSGGGVNPGIIAGPVVAVLLIASLGLFWWLRKKKRRDLARLDELAERAKKAESARYQLSNPNSPQGSATQSFVRGSAQQMPRPPPSASSRRQRSPIPDTAISYDEDDEYDGSALKELRSMSDRQRDPFADRNSASTGSTGSLRRHHNGFGLSDSREPEDTLGRNLHPARALDEARQNLYNTGGTAPRRPARAPELDLRLSPPKKSDQLRDPHLFSEPRDSFVSATSGAPSYLSGNSYDIHSDAPTIVTSKQVQIGRLQQAEVVHFGGRSHQLLETVGQHRVSPVDAEREDPFERGKSASGGNPIGSLRSLLPANRNTYDEDEEAVRYGEPGSVNPTDLRFSMGSLAYTQRDSMSTLGTSRFFGRAESGVPPPRPGNANFGPGVDRESMFSNKSAADSLLGTFPMIAPGQAGGAPPLPTSAFPQSTSITSLDHQALIARPPPTMRAPISPRTPTTVTRAGGPSRPQTATSVADSFLGNFPFVPPNMDDLAELPSANLPSAAMPHTAATKNRNYLGMSQMSEGLGGFDFSFEGAPPLPEKERE